MEIPIPSAPKIISPEISALCESLVIGGIPLYLDVNPSSDAIINECYQNVKKMIVEKGGSMQCGWQIWETIPGVLIEAEFHAVWKDVDDVYHDITPKEFPGVNKILFLSDPYRIYEGKQIDNVRIPLVIDPLIDLFIENEISYFNAINRGDLAAYHGEVMLTDELNKILDKRIQIGFKVLEKYYPDLDIY